MGRIVNVEAASRLRADHDDRRHGGQEFSQLLKQESERLSQAEAKGVENAGTVDLVETKMEGKMNIYTNHGIVNYFRMMTSMTDLRG